MRFLIFIGLTYLGYRALKSWVVKYISSINAIHGQGRTEIDDIMIQDPFCEVYFPKREGTHLSIEGNDLYFCSPECRDKFIAQGSGVRG
ncbi:MAG: hypothetical protein DRI57_02765 [Deltaproteobacteria bacterium]|nr:MAG: hypothetical protein DRI57_02765 [Deltaproteobacteria bacterium]